MARRSRRRFTSGESVDFIGPNRNFATGGDDLQRALRYRPERPTRDRLRRRARKSSR